jgi:hypothetical protein
MDIGTTIVGLIVVVLFVLPIILIARSANGGEKQLIDELNKIAAVQHCKIAHFDVLKNAAIGMDNEKFHLFFVRKKQGEIQNSTIDLKEIKKCQVVSSSKGTKSKSGTYKEIERIGLQFTYLIPTKNINTIDFYDVHTDNGPINGELQLANKWETKISKSVLEYAEKPKIASIGA